MKDRVRIKIIMLGDPYGMLIDVPPILEFLLRHVAGFLERRQIAVSVIITLYAGVAVPVPAAGSISSPVDDTKIRTPASFS